MKRNEEAIWERRMQTGPLRQKSFNSVQMEKIEQELQLRRARGASRTSGRVQRRAAAAALAFMLVLVIGAGILQPPWLSGLIGQLGFPGGFVNPATPGSNGEEPPVFQGEDALDWPLPLPDETLVEAAVQEQGRIADVLPFAPEEVQAVSLRTRSGLTVQLPDEHGKELVLRLGEVDFRESLIVEDMASLSPHPDTMLRFHTAGRIYIIPYASDYNVLHLGGGKVYADEYTAVRVLQYTNSEDARDAGDARTSP